MLIIKLLYITDNCWRRDSCQQNKTQLQGRHGDGIHSVDRRVGFLFLCEISKNLLCK